jgi:hypothetical protein
MAFMVNGSLQEIDCTKCHNPTAAVKPILQGIR